MYITARKKCKFPVNVVKFPTISYVFLYPKSQNFPSNVQISWEWHSQIPHFFEPWCTCKYNVKLHVSSITRWITFAYIVGAFSNFLVKFTTLYDKSLIQCNKITSELRMKTAPDLERTSVIIINDLAWIDCQILLPYWPIHMFPQQESLISSGSVYCDWFLQAGKLVRFVYAICNRCFSLN